MDTAETIARELVGFFYPLPSNIWIYFVNGMR